MNESKKNKKMSRFGLQATKHILSANTLEQVDWTHPVFVGLSKEKGFDGPNGFLDDKLGKYRRYRLAVIFVKKRGYYIEKGEIKDSDGRVVVAEEDVQQELQKFHEANGHPGANVMWQQVTI